MSENFKLDHGVSVAWLGSYPGASVNGPGRGVYHLVRAFKHLTGHARHQYRISRQSGLETRNLKQALKWFGSVCALILEIENPTTPVVFVPIPDSNCVIGESTIPRARRLADAIVANTRISAVVCDSLRWKHRLVPSHLRGTREPERLYRDLKVICLPQSGTIILVDDVVTTGAHILAASAKLESAAHVSCSRAICVARTEPAGGLPFAIRQASILPSPHSAMDSVVVFYFRTQAKAPLPMDSVVS